MTEGEDLLNSGSALLGLFSCISVRLLGLGMYLTSWCHARGAFTFIGGS